MIKVQTVPPDKAALAARQKRDLLKEIGAKWRKFSETELSGFAVKDELVTQVALLYGLDKSDALLQVDAVLKGRRL